MTTQPEALRLAQHINDLFVSQWGMNSSMAKDSKIVLAELRRLHESNTELLVALKDLINCADPHRDWEEFKAARAAINKAERTTT
jgi:hypothetical protein